ncbi:ESX secretion-associated protein EspG [Blastococcus sp. LR1]|uniref:ESX secretion-associated protein EspG n=1 Tax=Blastococcus sp. LR1 TaxID=2877000 RepID=UPI001CCACEF4|nr:ESX secretion-associated protein EspG [Blastococcus sp. LR1]MCA0143769.1 ESX secretion-associated protein EspG [Blastococcus sp. LR1]
MSADPRRLTLTAAEWAVLVTDRLPDPPAAFVPAPVPPADRDGAVASLVAARVLVVPAGGSPRPVPPVAADLAVLSRPLMTIRLEVKGRAGARQGWFALGPGVVVGVLTLPGGGVELSLAPAVRLGTELARAVPDAPAVTGPWPTEEEPTDGVPVSGGVPLSLLEDKPSPEASEEERRLTQELERRTRGSLSCLVLGRTGPDLGVGQVSWMATDAGWVGLRPRLDGSPRRMVDLVPVEPADLGTWVAPTVAALLEADDDQL